MYVYFEHICRQVKEFSVIFLGLFNFLALLFVSVKKKVYILGFQKLWNLIVHFHSYYVDFH